MYVVTKTGCNKNFLVLPFAGKRVSVNRHVLKTGEVFIKYVQVRDLYTVLRQAKLSAARGVFFVPHHHVFTWSVFTLLKYVALKQ